jgi:exodeoxyribonuclease VII small subunit
MTRSRIPKTAALPRLFFPGMVPMDDRLPAAGPAVQAPADEGPAPQNFEQAMAELEDLVRRMEGGELGLEGALAAYRRGAVLVAFCRNALAAVQEQVRVLEGDLLRPFEADGAAQP